MPILSPECQAFLAHWSALRKDGLMPTSEDFLDHSRPELAPSTIMVELINGDLLIRLEGSEVALRWGREATGRPIYADRPQSFRAKIIDNVTRQLAHPCGCRMLNEYTTSAGRTVRSEAVLLPLAVKAGRPPRMVLQSRELDRRHEMESMTTRHNTVEIEWIDIGAGVPDAPPLRPQLT